MQSRRGIPRRLFAIGCFDFGVFAFCFGVAMRCAMQPAEFASYHLPGLERDEAKHSIILAALARLAGDTPPEMLWWSLGEPGQCAIKSPGYPILLGELTAAQCHALADATLALDYP